MPTATQEQPSRTQDLAATLDNLLQSHAEWQAGDEKNLSRELCDAIEAAVEVWNAGDVPGGLRQLAPRIEALERHWTAWLMTAGTGDGLDVPAPESGHVLWQTIGLIGKEKDQREQQSRTPIKYVEPIAQLVEEKVPRTQICRMYRAHWASGDTDGPGLWDNAKQQPMLARLAQEIKAPGSILGDEPDQFVTYETVEHLQREKTQREAADRAAGQIRARKTKAIGPDQTPLEDLVAEGVSGMQIARMKQVAVEEIEQQCKERGLPLPKRSYGEIRPSDGKFAPETTDAGERIREAQSRAFQNRQRLEQMKTEKPSPPLVDALPARPADAFGGDPDEMEAETGPGEAAGGFPDDAAVGPRIGDLERQVAEIMQTGQTKPKEIASALGRDDWQNIRNVVGRLKGDPSRLEAALKQ